MPNVVQPVRPVQPVQPPAPMIAQYFPTSQTQAFAPASNYSPEKQSNKNTLIFSIAGGTAALVLIAALFTFTRSPSPVSVDVSLTVVDQTCYDLSWGYFDIPGAALELEVDGVTMGYATFPSTGNSNYLGCEFSATFYDIPPDGQMYSYAFASGRRGVITKSREELEADGWSMDLTIG